MLARCVFTILELEPALQSKEDKIEHLSSYAHAVHTTAEQVIRGKNENVCEMFQMNNNKEGKI